MHKKGAIDHLGKERLLDLNGKKGFKCQKVDL
jgi:hypothetical protein